MASTQLAEASVVEISVVTAPTSSSTVAAATTTTTTPPETTTAMAAAAEKTVTAVAPETPAATAMAPATIPAAPPPSQAKDGSSKATKADAKTQKTPGANAATGGDAPKKLTGAEMKALKQAEKAKRRAAVIAAKEAVTAAGAGAAASPAPGGATQAKPAAPGGSGGAGKAKGKQDRAEAAGGGGGGGTVASGALPHRPAAATTAATGSTEKDRRGVIPDIFSHLSMAKRIPLNQAHKDVHPAVLAVGQQMSTFTLRDNIARVEATLEAFKKVIQSYRTPPGNAFSRHFVSHVLNPQIEYLTECRPMCFAMGNAIRLVKARVSQLDPNTDDKDAIPHLCESIDNFIQERICLAAVGITRTAAAQIFDGSVILTYGGPRLVRAALQQAWDNGVSFDLIVVEDAGNVAASRSMAKHFSRLRRRHTPPADSTLGAAAAYLLDEKVGVTYSPSLDGIDFHVKAATLVILGAESMFANGSLLGPAGTCDVAMAAYDAGRPVITLCELINFDRDRVCIDALGHNEIDPDSCDADGFRLLFDLTMPSMAGSVITEYEEAGGQAPAAALSMVLRNKEDLNW